MARYSKLRNITVNNVKHRSTPIYPEILESDNDIYVISQYGDRLDTIAFDFYQDPHKWWIIAKANGLTDLNIEQGTSLRIPILRDDIKVK